VLAFRRRYGLSPRDPRVLELSQLEIELDNELAIVLAQEPGDEVEPRTCDVCGSITFQLRCPVCPGRPSLSLLERLVEREEAGEVVDWAREWDAVVGTPRPLNG
jgi:hypothetical protein